MATNDNKPNENRREPDDILEQLEPLSDSSIRKSNESTHLEQARSRTKNSASIEPSSQKSAHSIPPDKPEPASLNEAIDAELSNLSLSNLSKKELEELQDAKGVLAFLSQVRIDLDAINEAGVESEVAELTKRSKLTSEQLANQKATNPETQQFSNEHTRGQQTGPEQAAATSPKNRIGRFEILELIGQGGFAKVFRAFDPDLDRELAIKVPKAQIFGSTELQIRFQREAKAAAILSHPSIVPVYDVGSVGMLHYIASEYCPGSDLSNWIKTKQEVTDLRTSVKIVAKLADAVQHAHQRSVVHRDLKPANVLITNEDAPIEDRLRITDFGLAKQLNSDDATVTTEGTILGTPAYMAPEQARGEKDCGPAADLYSLGVMLYELLTGQMPFVKKSHVQTLLAIQSDPPVSPSKLQSAIPKDLEAICLKSISKSPTDRYRSAFDFGADLRNWLEGRTVTARPASALQRLTRWANRNRALAAALAFAIASLSIGLALTSWKWRESNQNLTLANEQTTIAQQESAKATESALDAKRSAERATGVLDTVVGAFLSTHPLYGGKPNMPAKQVLINAAASVSSSDLDDEGRAIFFAALARSFIGLGEFADAVLAAEQSHLLHEKVFGKNDIRTIETQNLLATAHYRNGSLNDALALQEDTVDRLQQIDEPIELALDSNRNLAVTLSHLGQLQRAQDLLREVIVLSESSTGLASRKAEALRNLAETLLAADDNEQALQFAEEALAISTDLQAADHPSVLSSKSTLVRVLSHLDRLEEALEISQELLSLNKQTFGEDHPATIVSMLELGTCLSASSQFTEAHSQLKAATDLSVAELGAKHPITLQAQDGLANAMLDAESFDEAATLFQSNLVTQRDLYGDAHPNVIRTMIGLTDAYQEADKMELAGQQCEKVLQKLEGSVDEDHPLLLKAKYSQINSLIRTQKFQDAVNIGEQQLTVLENKYSRSHTKTVMLMNSLSVCYFYTGRIDDALTMLEEILAIQSERLGHDVPEVIGMKLNIAGVYTKQKRFAEAIEKYEEILDASIKSLPPEHFYIQSARGYHAIAIMDSGEQDRGLELLDKVHDDNEDNIKMGWVRLELIRRFQKAGRGEDLARVMTRELEANRIKHATTEPFANLLWQYAHSLIELDRYETAQTMLLECVEIRKAIDADSWLVANAESLLGEAMVGLDNKNEGLALLERGYSDLVERAAAIPENNRNATLWAAAQRLLSHAQSEENSEGVAKWQAEVEKWDGGDDRP